MKEAWMNVWPVYLLLALRYVIRLEHNSRLARFLYRDILIIMISRCQAVTVSDEVYSKLRCSSGHSGSGLLFMLIWIRIWKTLVIAYSGFSWREYLYNQE
ncbi:hypothetical protein BD289DRAFT_26378 [Coniella lustricola]|uniref:Uncharacterized protein n=1 Tax=Coniella lustricola TaxID=2025994 RepID=A0A2T3A337_9PEZI|nr:hypothetical protein BD289DRAFT_26378 [Coniella lustricola]